MYCRDSKTTGEFSTGKFWDDVWKLDFFFKRHLCSKPHTESVRKLRSKNPNLRGTLVNMLLESPVVNEKTQIINERKRTRPKEIKFLSDSILLAIQMTFSCFLFKILTSTGLST